MKTGKIYVGAMAALLLSALSPAAAEQRIETTAAFKGVQKLILELAHVDVKLRPASGDMRATPINFDEKYEKLYAETSGSTLTLRVDYKPRTVSFFGTNNKWPTLSVELPKGVELVVRSGSGDMDIQNIGASSMNLSASSGDIELYNSSGNATMSASSGDIEIKNLNGLVSVKTSSGDISISGTMVKNLEASSGDISLSNTSGDLVAQTSSGDIDLNGHEGSMDLSASSGDITLNSVQGKLSLSTTSGEIEGSKVMIRDAATIKSSSGSISLDFDNPESELSFNLKSSSGSLRAIGSSSDKGSLVTGRGRIEVVGKSTSGSQSYRAR